MDNKTTIVIRAEKDGKVGFSLAEPILTRELVGIFEMCKMIAFENRIPQDKGASTVDPEEVDLRHQVVKATRNVFIKEEHISNRAKNCLLSLGVNTLEELLRCNEIFISRIRNMGKGTIAEIKNYINYKGYEIGCLEPFWVQVDGNCAKLSNNTQYTQFQSCKEANDYVNIMNESIYKKEI